MKEKIKKILKKAFPYFKYGFAMYIMLISAILFGFLYLLLQGCCIVSPDGDIINGFNNLTVQVYQESVDK